MRLRLEKRRGVERRGELHGAAHSARERQSSWQDGAARGELAWSEQPNFGERVLGHGAEAMCGLCSWCWRAEGVEEE
jgi:hypothetical protein